MTASAPRGSGETPRQRNPKATAAAILAAARDAFTRDGYDAVGLRRIAGEAGVDASAIIRHFGSKDGLYAAAMRTEDYMPAFEVGDRSGLADRLVRRMLDMEPESVAYDTFLALLRSVGSRNAGPHVGQLLRNGVVKTMAAEIEGDDAELRASLVSACLLGVAISRHMLLLDPMATASADQVSTILAPALQSCLDNSADKGTQRLPQKS